MPRTGERSNFFIRKGTIIMATPGKEERVVSSVSGSFVGIAEKVTRKAVRSTHWIVVELDNDNMGPTKGVYLNAESFNAVSGVVALFRLGVVLKEGDNLSFKVYGNNAVRIELNGNPILPEKGDKSIFEEQNNSFEKMLDAIRGEHKEVDFWNQAESDYFMKVRDLVKEHIYWLEEDDIKSLVLSKFLPDIPDLKPDCSFEEIYPLLRHKFSDEVI